MNSSYEWLQSFHWILNHLWYITIWGIETKCYILNKESLNCFVFLLYLDNFKYLRTYISRFLSDESKFDKKWYLCNEKNLRWGFFSGTKFINTKTYVILKNVTFSFRFTISSTSPLTTLELKYSALRSHYVLKL